MVLGGVRWTNDYVLTQVNGQNISELYFGAADMSVRMPEKINKLHILRQAVEKGYGGIDGDVFASNTPLMIEENSAVEIFFGQRSFMESFRKILILWRIWGVLSKIQYILKYSFIG